MPDDGSISASLAESPPKINETILLIRWDRDSGDYSYESEGPPVHIQALTELLADLLQHLKNHLTDEQGFISLEGEMDEEYVEEEEDDGILDFD